MPLLKNDVQISQNSPKDPERTQPVWLLAIRPKTLSASVAPVLMGTAMAFGDGIGHWPSAIVALACALLIQIGTNLANDYYDFKNGADQEDRIGPQRVTQAGLIAPEKVKHAFIAVFTLTAFSSIYLILRGGWPIALIAVLAILSGLLYTAGPYPLGYLGLGEIFVLIFFGPVAVGGTYYVQSLEINGAVLLSGLGPGFLSVAILVVNNLRDIESDRKTNKRTLAVRFGRLFARGEYLFCILAASAVPFFVFWYTADHFPTLLAAATAFLAIPLIRTVFTQTDGPRLNQALAMTGKLLFLYTVLFSVGWMA